MRPGHVCRSIWRRAPHVVKDPSGVPKGSWLITDGLVPIGVSHFFDGLVFAKPDGISNIETGNFAKAADFNAAFRWEDFPEGWDPVARLQAQDRDGVEAEILVREPGTLLLWPHRRSVSACDPAVLQRLAGGVLQLQPEAPCRRAAADDPGDESDGQRHPRAGQAGIQSSRRSRARSRTAVTMSRSTSHSGARLRKRASSFLSTPHQRRGSRGPI